MESRTSFQIKIIMNTWSNCCTFDSYVKPTKKGK